MHETQKRVLIGKIRDKLQSKQDELDEEKKIFLYPYWHIQYLLDPRKESMICDIRIFKAWERRRNHNGEMYR